MATKGIVRGVIANMVTLKVDGPVAQNEICYIETGGDKLMSEVIKVVGENVFVEASRLVRPPSLPVTCWRLRWARACCHTTLTVCRMTWTR